MITIALTKKQSNAIIHLDFASFTTRRTVMDKKEYLLELRKLRKKIAASQKAISKAKTKTAKAKAAAAAALANEACQKLIDEMTKSGFVIIEANQTGVFYRNQAPEAKNLVEIGDVVEPGTKLGLLEAMKVFWEITYEGSALMEVADILAHNGHLVQKEDILFILAPTS